MSCRQKQLGFTLIEVLIAVAILATLAMLSSRSITQAVKSKVKIQEQIDDVSKMRDALRIITRDINLAFHYRDIEKELTELIKKKATQKQTAGQPPPGSQPQPPLAALTPPTPREAERKDPTTHFIGTNESLAFVSMNSARTTQNTKQSDHIEVGYIVRECQSSTGQGSSKCLWRRTSPAVDSDVTAGGVEIVLLENISEFSLQYIGKGKQDWVKEWRTNEAGDDVTKGSFPQAVEISLGVKIDEPLRKKTYKMQVVASVHFPNNKEESK
jgi:prepilin-type N-terminal cleavage/methylation domain-containing protein